MKEDASCGSDREVSVKRGKPVKLAATKDQVATSSAIENRYGARLAIRKGNRAVVIILAFLTVVAIPPAGLIRGFSGVFGAVCALAIMWVVAAIGIGANQLVLRNPLRTTTYVFGAYLVKLLTVLVAVAALRPISQVDNPTIFLVLVIAILLTTIGEAAVVSKSNRLIIGRI